MGSQVFNLSIAAIFLQVIIVILDLKVDSVGISFLANSVQTAIFLSYVARMHVTLIVVYYIFVFSFLCIIPWVHYSHSIVIWRASPIDEGIYWYANALIFATNIILFISGKYDSGSVVKNSISITALNAKKKNLTIIHAVFFTVLSLLGFLVTFFLADFSVGNLLIRGFEGEIRTFRIEQLSLLLLIGQTAKVLPFFVFCYVATEIENNHALKVVLLLLMLLTVFPTGVSRYLVGMVYIPVLLIYITRLRDARVFSVVFIISLLVIFPFLDQFREFSTIDIISFVPTAEFFIAAHFDAYENFASSIDYEYISYGWQLLGSLFFYVPRIFWVTKPIGSGQQMADDNGYVFNNISMPYLGEGYVNFGLLGVLAFAYVLSLGIGEIDRRFRDRVLPGCKIRFPETFYLYLLGSFFFLLRGDMMSSVAYISAGAAVYYLLRYYTK